MSMQKSTNQLSYTKLAILLATLIIIWILCNKGQTRLENQFYEEFSQRMGRDLAQRGRLAAALAIKNAKSDQQRQKRVSQLDKELLSQYGMNNNNEKYICLMVRNFEMSAKGQLNYLTPKSIINQNYSNHRVIYASNISDTPWIVQMQIIHFYTQNLFPGFRYKFADLQTDTNWALFYVSSKCPKDGIMVVIQNQEQLLSPNVLNVINKAFQDPDTDIVWANSLYKNDKLGFSFDYPESVKKSKSFRQFPYVANDVVAFRNTFLIENKEALQGIYPLSLPQSYGLKLLEKAKSTKYINEILTIKNRNFEIVDYKASQKSSIAQAIRKNQQI